MMSKRRQDCLEQDQCKLEVRNRNEYDAAFKNRKNIQSGDVRVLMEKKSNYLMQIFPFFTQKQLVKGEWGEVVCRLILRSFTLLKK